MDEVSILSELFLLMNALSIFPHISASVGADCLPVTYLFLLSGSSGALFYNSVISLLLNFAVCQACYHSESETNNQEAHKEGRN